MPTGCEGGVRRALLITTLYFCCWMSESAYAQPRSLQTPREEFELPEPEIAPEPAPERILPPVPLPPDPRRLEAGIRVEVEAFRFEGNTVFEDAELAAVVQSWTGREIASAELEAAREALTRHYVDHGYVSSGALIPDQEVTDRSVLVRIVEGRLSRVVVEGTKWFRPSYFEKRLLLQSDRPLRIQDIEERLQLFEQDPRIERLAARLGPGATRGDAILRLEVTEELPIRLGAEWTNDTPVSFGEQTANAFTTFSNLLGGGDRISGGARVSEGLLELDGQWRVPVTPWDTEFEAHVRNSDGEVVRGPFRKAEIESEVLTAGVSIFQPVWLTRETTARLALIGQWRRSQTRVGERFSFPGSGADEETGISKLTALRIGGEYIHRRRNWVVAFRQLLSFGLPVLGHTANPSGIPDGEFFSSLSQLRLALRNPKLADTELLIRLDAQFASDPLMPIEQIGVGGIATVRGYAENEVVRDQAIISSLEFRVPLYRTPMDSHVLELAPFVDFGRAWNRARLATDLENRTLVGVGVGLRYRSRHLGLAEIYWGTNLTDRELLPSSAQKEGLYFRLGVDLP